MSPPLNPYAESFQPTSYSLIPFKQLPTVLPPYHHPNHLIQLPPCFYNQHPPPKREEICYGFPSLPPPPTKLTSDYTHHGSLMIMATLDLYEANRIGTGCFLNSQKKSTGCFLKTSTGRSRKFSKKLQLPPPPPPPAPSHELRQIHSSRCCTSKKQQWQLKSGAVVNGVGGAALASTANVVDVPKPPKFSSGQVYQFGSKTSVMIKNIPNKYCREMLLKLLVNHCKKENEKEMNSEVTKSAFDFVYLPMDFETECNKGYAFVNFTNPNGVWRLFNFLNYRRWNEFNSRKICEVTYAKIQGKVALVKHFNGSSFACERDEFLPVYFNPFRDGSVQDEAVEMVTVGTRIPRLLPSSSAVQLK